MAYFNYRCLAEDPSDRFNYVWCAIFFVTLASACWIAPVTFNGNYTQGASCNHESLPERINLNNVTCWMPSELSDAMINYAHTVCKQAMEVFLNNETKSTLTDGVKLYKYTTVPSPGQDEPLPYPDFLTSRGKIADNKLKTKNAMRESIPVFLFLLGVTFLIPKMIWSFILTFSSLNIDGTLSAVADWRENSVSCLREIGTTIKSSLRNSSCMAWGYLFTKLLYALVCIVGCLYLILVVQADFNESANFEPDSKTSRQISMKTPYADTAMCGLKITQIQNVQSYLIQCAFVEKIESDESNLGSPQLCGNNLNNWSSSFSAVLTVTREMLILMALINVIQLITWVVRLVCGRRWLKGRVSMDRRLVNRFASFYVDGFALIRLELLDNQDQRGDGDHKEELHPF